MNAFESGVIELEAAVERNDLEGVDPNNLRGLLKALRPGLSSESADSTTQLQNLGSRIWNACVKLNNTISFNLVNVKVSNYASFFRGNSNISAVEAFGM